MIGNDNVTYYMKKIEFHISSLTNNHSGLNTIFWIFWFLYEVNFNHHGKQKFINHKFRNSSLIETVRGEVILHKISFLPFSTINIKVLVYFSSFIIVFADMIRSILRTIINANLHVSCFVFGVNKLLSEFEICFQLSAWLNIVFWSNNQNFR